MIIKEMIFWLIVNVDCVNYVVCVWMFNCGEYIIVIYIEYFFFDFLGIWIKGVEVGIFVVIFLFEYDEIIIFVQIDFVEIIGVVSFFVLVEVCYLFLVLIVLDIDFFNV